MLMSGENREKLEFKIDSMRSVVRRAGEVTLEPSLLRLSVGVATYPEDGSDAEELLAEADRRIYKNKRQRKKDRAAEIPIEWTGQTSATVSPQTDLAELLFASAADPSSPRGLALAPANFNVDVIASAAANHTNLDVHTPDYMGWAPIGDRDAFE
jgi:hypothetical protein